MTNPTPLRLGIAGITGRMGQKLLSAAAGDPTVTITAGTSRTGTSTALLSQVTVATDILHVFPEIDVLIDFTTPTATVGNAEQAILAGCPLVVGTTGLSDKQMTTLRRAADHVPVWYARNMSHGIATLLTLLPSLVELLEGYDIELVETHHRGKRDAPSGTALMLAEAIERGRGQATPQTFGRRGIAPRHSGEIGIHALRGGGNVGEHDILFASDVEEIRVCHRTLERRAFAVGAIRAAKEIAGLPPGWYSPAEAL